MKNNLQFALLLSILKKTILIVFILSSYAYSYGQAGNALNFDGNNDRVDLPFVISGSYTKEAWINLSNLSAYNNFISGQATAFWAPNAAGVMYGSRLSAGHGGGFNDVQDPIPLTAGVWYHVAVTFDSTTSLMVLYKNGVQVDSEVLGGFYAENVQYIGAFFDGSTLNYTLNGTIDEVRIWSVARTGAQILANMNCSLTGDEPGLDAYYKFNQGAAGESNAGVTTLLDSSDKCPVYNGTLVNFALSENTSNWITSGATVIGTCLNSSPNILVTGNTICITSGDNSPSVTDFTDFGLFSGTPLVQTFTISNTGNADLDLTTFQITGANAADFTINGQPTTLTPGTSTTFTVTFNTQVSGIKLATVVIGSSDDDEGTFTFNVTANTTSLPVEITFFTAEKGSKNVKLSWQTASEHNNLGFEIERSDNGTTGWRKIAFITGIGNSSGKSNYSINDFSPVRGNNYYRLKQIDVDRNSRYSQIKYINYTGILKALTIYPTLTNDKLTINIGDNSLINTELIFVDFSGKVVKKQIIKQLKEELSVSSLPKGIYIIKTVSGAAEKFVKQ